MFRNSSVGRLTEMGCCGCFGFARRPKRTIWHISGPVRNASQEFLLDEDLEDDDDVCQYNGEATGSTHGDGDGDDYQPQPIANLSEQILMFRTQNGLICREVPVKETNKVIRSEDENGNKMVNEYVRECKIGAGSYGKVVLYRSSVDGKHYAIKVLIMKMLDHPNIVNLIEVIDDPTTDHFYMVLEYVEGKWVCEGSGPPGGLGENKARKYLRDIVSGLMYLHAHNIVHGDIKPDNLLVAGNGTVKIGDFSVSQVFEDDNDVLRRSPGTPVFTAPECCLGLTYHGKAADTWAVGVTLYCMVLGKYPFLGDTLQDTYDKIVNNPLSLPRNMNPQIKNLIEGLLCKGVYVITIIAFCSLSLSLSHTHTHTTRPTADPKQRMTLNDVAEHSWVIAEEGPIPQYLCWCKRNRLQNGQAKGNAELTGINHATN
ncbi:Protein kinase domain [Dillenia turbinata]|uniref:Protein kinase domain n=1 Tax=Dillenia turbinata TaxID=194707 RepID=A0AAN8ZCZ5_9MAGN